MQGFNDYLKSCTTQEIEGETLKEAQARAALYGRSVCWNGHRIQPSGAMYAYNH